MIKFSTNRNDLARGRIIIHIYIDIIRKGYFLKVTQIPILIPVNKVLFGQTSIKMKLQNYSFYSINPEKVWYKRQGKFNERSIKNIQFAPS